MSPMHTVADSTCYETTRHSIKSCWAIGTTSECTTAIEWGGGILSTGPKHARMSKPFEGYSCQKRVDGEELSWVGHLMRTSELRVRNLERRLVAPRRSGLISLHICQLPLCEQLRLSRRNDQAETGRIDFGLSVSSPCYVPALRTVAD